MLTWVSVAMAIAAVGLIVLAKFTPWYTDYAAFSARDHAIYADGVRAGERTDWDAMSEAFHANRHRYETNKWRYADAGYLLAAWSPVLGLLSLLAARHGFGFLFRNTARLIVVVPLTALTSLGVGVSILAPAVHAAGRIQVPIWADSIGIPIMMATTLTQMLAPILAVLTITPVLFRRRSSGRLLVATRPPHWPALVATLVYAPALALAALLLAGSLSTGGWAASVTGVLMLWLMLNARSLWIHLPAPKA